MNIQNRSVEITYHVEPEYWTFHLKIKVDGHSELLRSMTYELPRQLKIFSWVIEDVPVHMIPGDTSVKVYWGGIAIGVNASVIVDLQSTLDYIRMYLS